MSRSTDQRSTEKPWPLSDEAKRFLDERVDGPAEFIRSLADPSGCDESSAAPSSEEQSALASPPEERYEIQGELATGGSGRVLHAFDRDMRRVVALKVLRDPRGDATASRRLLEEARATGQLEHPNIPPVYDFGFHRDYGVYFTMQLVRGRTLHEILRDCAVGRLETLRHFSLVRLVQVLQQVAMGVHYAHVRGVVHRDLKPENIMVGDYGEVLVMDWGVAKITQTRPDSTRIESPVRTEDQRGSSGTKEGTVAGTLSYMSPEQARGEIGEIDSQSDVFGLGAVLYEILTFHPPREGSSRSEVLDRARRGEILRPTERAPRNEIPETLEAICLRALATDKASRSADAMAFHEDLQVFLDGTLETNRRRRESASLANDGARRARDYVQLTEEERDARERAERELTAHETHDPIERKSAAWSLLDNATKIHEQRIESFNDATAALHAALSVDPSCELAQSALAELYWSRFVEAERAGNRDDASIYRRLVERFDRGEYNTRLADRGELSIETAERASRVDLRRVIDHGWRLEELPLDASREELSPGHYVAKIEGAPGFASIRAPIEITRDEPARVRAVPPRESDAPPGFLFIAGGPCRLGGDDAAPGSLSAQTPNVRDFFLAELPVTFREYCEFLDALAEAKDPELDDLVAATEKEGHLVERDDGRFVPARAALDIETRTLERHDEDFYWRLPIIGITWRAATRFASWRSSRDGLHYRLPNELEWEKAARGVVGLPFPWGSRLDWSLTKGGLSRPERAQIEPVGSFASDRSIYGVRDLAGSVLEWCSDWLLENQYRVVRGSSWVSTHEGGFRSAHRAGFHPDHRSSVIGMRLAAESGSVDET